MAYTKTQLEDLWKTAGGAPGVAPFAAAIALAESGGRPEATNATHDFGLWQINAPTWVGKIPGVPTTSAEQLKDPFTNARGAVAISRAGTDWHPWCVAYSDGACGTRGGTYLGPGSPVLRYTDTPVPGAPPAPDAPIGSPVGGQSPGALAGGNAVAGSTSTGVPPVSGAPQVPGFGGALGQLDSLMNPNTSLWSGLTNPLGTSEKLALMVVARGGFLALGFAMIGVGVWLALGRHVPGIAAGAAEGGVAGGVGGAAVGAAVGASKTAGRVKTAAARGARTKRTRAREARQDEIDADVEHAARTAPTGEAKKAQAKRAAAARRSTPMVEEPGRAARIDKIHATHEARRAKAAAGAGSEEPF